MNLYFFRNSASLEDLREESRMARTAGVILGLRETVIYQLVQEYFKTFNSRASCTVVPSKYQHSQLEKRIGAINTEKGKHSDFMCAETLERILDCVP